RRESREGFRHVAGHGRLAIPVGNVLERDQEENADDQRDADKLCHDLRFDAYRLASNLLEQEEYGQSAVDDGHRQQVDTRQVGGDESEEPDQPGQAALGDLRTLANDSHGPADILHAYLSGEDEVLDRQISSDCDRIRTRATLYECLDWVRFAHELAELI